MSLKTQKKVTKTKQEIPSLKSVSMGKNPFSLSRSSTRRRRSKPSFPSLSPITQNTGSTNSSTAVKGKKKAIGTRLWMRFHATGTSEMVEYEKSTIINRSSIPPRDLRILGPIFSPASRILAREKAMIVNLEFIKAIVTAEEVLILDPLQKEVIQFVDQLRRQHPLMNQGSGSMDVSVHSDPVSEASEGMQSELPFEFQVLEIALEVVCSFLGKRVSVLETDAYPVLDELARNVSNKSLEHVRSLKSNVTHLLARVQKVRDEIEHLLDDNEDMAHLYLTRKRMQIQQSDAPLNDAFSSCVTTSLPRLNSTRSRNSSSHFFNDHDVEDLEMLLEAYFVQLDGMRNKILSVRGYIDDTEDYVNIQLDNQRNELIELQLTLTILSFAITIETLITGWFGMNIPCSLYKKNGIFEIFVGGVTLGSFLIFVLILGYAKWTKLIGS